MQGAAKRSSKLETIVDTRHYWSREYQVLVLLLGQGIFQMEKVLPLRGDRTLKGGARAPTLFLQHQNLFSSFEDIGCFKWIFYGYQMLAYDWSRGRFPVDMYCCSGFI